MARRARNSTPAESGDQAAPADKPMLIANKAFSYGGRYLRPGQEFAAPAKHGRLLEAIGRASYRTRVMVAEPVNPVDSEKSSDGDKPEDDAPEQE